MIVDPVKILEKYCATEEALKILVEHGEAVSRKALEIAQKNPQEKADIGFLKEASFLHDVGVTLTHAPDIGCFGEKPYLLHGVIGREVLETEGLAKHALVCERHVGVAITAQEIKEKNLSLPERDMIPLSVEEEIIALADKFFSKAKDLSREKTIAEVESLALRHGEEKKKTIKIWIKKYHLTENHGKKVF